MAVRVPDFVTRGWPVEIELSETMPGPIDVVWELVTDWENLGDWQLEARDFTVISDQREGIGVVAEATVSIAGITTRDKVRVSGWEPPKRLGIEHQGWVSGAGEMHLTPIGKDRTHLFWREVLSPPLGVLGALGLTGFKPAMRRIFARDLRVLAALVRARTTSPK
jgi:carbon monoxide dehydrogenase subunit G